MTAVVLDTGALIGFERNDRRIVAIIVRALEHHDPLLVPAGVVAQAWRDGSRQTRLARLRARCSSLTTIRLEPPDKSAEWQRPPMSSTLPWRSLRAIMERGCSRPLRTTCGASITASTSSPSKFKFPASHRAVSRRGPVTKRRFAVAQNAEPTS